MYANVLFSLPETTKLELRKPMSFFESNPMKRMVSVLHDPGGDGNQRIAVNLVSFTLGTPLKLLRSVMGARFIQGEVDDTDRLSVCSFRIDVMKNVEKSTKNYLESKKALDDAGRFRRGPQGFRGQSNLCQEIVLPGHDVYGSAPDTFPTPVEAQQTQDSYSQFRRTTSLSRDFWAVDHVDWGAPTLDTPNERWQTRPAGVDVIDNRQESIYRAFADRISIATQQALGQGAALRGELAHEAADEILRVENGLFLDQLRTRAHTHNSYYNRLVRRIYGGDYDGDAVTAMTNTALTYQTEDRRPHLPQNQRNRGPAPRNRRW